MRIRLIHQVFHALPEMTSPGGEPVSAVYGFTRDLLYLVEDKRPDFLFCAFDVRGKTFRHGSVRGVQGHAGGDARRPGAADSP